MKFYEFIIFLILDFSINKLVVKMEIRNNIELFKDLEVPERWKKKKIKE